MKTYVIVFKRVYEMSYKPYKGNSPKDAKEKALADGWGNQGWRVIAIFTPHEWTNAVKRS